MVARFDAHSSGAECSSPPGCDTEWMGEWTVCPS